MRFIADSASSPNLSARDPSTARWVSSRIQASKVPKAKSTTAVGPKILETSPSAENQFEAHRPAEETIFEDVVTVDIGREGCWYRQLPLEIGDTLEADLHVIDGEDINWSIMSKKNLFAWLDGANPAYVVGEENVRARDIKWKARKGTWYFVLDAFLKRYPRKVSIRLRRVHVP